MAYLVELQQKCEAYSSGCTRRATVELVDYVNERRGKFCPLHGRMALKKREEWENSEAGRSNRAAAAGPALH